MTRDDLSPWLRWMPGWLLLPVTAAFLVCILYPLFAVRGLLIGLLMGLKQARVEVRAVLQFVRDIIEGEEG